MKEGGGKGEVEEGGEIQVAKRNEKGKKWRVEARPREGRDPKNAFPFQRGRKGKKRGEGKVVRELKKTSRRKYRGEGSRARSADQKDRGKRLKEMSGERSAREAAWGIGKGGGR